jgi:hypothetical protein
MSEFINQHWVAYLVSVFYLFGVFCYWNSSLFDRRDWWLAFVVPVSFPVFVMRRHPWWSACVCVCVLFVWGVLR